LILLRIMDLEGIVKEFNGFSIVVTMFAANSLSGKLYRMVRGILRDLEVVVHVNNLVLALDGSCWYLFVIIKAFKYGS
jgi:hypothetical protein